MLRDQGCLRQVHPGLGDRRTYDRAAGRDAPMHHTSPGAAHRRRRGPQRSRVPVPGKIRSGRSLPQPGSRIDGPVASDDDNTAMESMHALPQKTVLESRRWQTRDELHEAIVL